MFSLHPEGMKVIPTHSKRITLVDLEETQPGKQAKRPASVDKWLQLGTVERLCVLRDAIHFTPKTLLNLIFKSINYSKKNVPLFIMSYE